MSEVWCLRRNEGYAACFDAVERIMGIEPTSAAWEAAVLPMNYIRIGALPDLHRSTAPGAASEFLRASLMRRSVPSDNSS